MKAIFLLNVNFHSIPSKSVHKRVICPLQWDYVVMGFYKILFIGYFSRIKFDSSKKFCSPCTENFRVQVQNGHIFDGGMELMLPDFQEWKVAPAL